MQAIRGSSQNRSSPQDYKAFVKMSMVSGLIQKSGKAKFKELGANYPRRMQQLNKENSRKYRG